MDAEIFNTRGLVNHLYELAGVDATTRQSVNDAADKAVVDFINNSFKDIIEKLDSGAKTANAAKRFRHTEVGRDNAATEAHLLEGFSRELKTKIKTITNANKKES